MTSAGTIRALRRFKARLMKRRVATHHPDVKDHPAHLGRLAGAPARCHCPECTKERKYTGAPFSEQRHPAAPEPDDVQLGLDEAHGAA